MRRLIPLLFACLLVTVPVMAQDVAAPEDSTALARRYAEEARRYAEDAANYLGVFESVGVAIGVLTGLVIPVIAVIGGFAGIRSLREARRELTETREMTERDLEAMRQSLTMELRAKQAELDAVKRELEETARYERARSEQATLALSLLPLAERQYGVKDYEGALDTYHRALDLDRENIVIHYRLGYVYTHMGKLDEATNHLDHVLKHDPNFAPALANLGYVLRRRAETMPQNEPMRGEMMADAEIKMRRALQISPKLVDEDGESWWGVLGGLHKRRGQIDDAIDAYERALKVTPHASYPLGNLAMLYMQKNDRDHMVETYRRVERIAMQKTRADAADHWAWADLLTSQLALGQFSEAQETLDSLLAAAPGSAADALRILLNTLTQLQQILGGRHGAGMQPFIERLEAHLAWTGQRN